MNTRGYYPTRIPAQIIWNENFLTKVPTYETPLGLPPAHVDACVASLKYVNYVLGDWLNDVRSLGPAATEIAELLLYGTGPDAVVLPTYTPAPLPTGIAAVPPGAINRLFALIALIKASPGYNASIGEDLGIIAPEEAAPDLATIKPELKLETTGGHVMVKWGWQGLRKHVTALELRVNRGAGPVFLTIDTTPNYLDTEPLPSTSAKWTYEAIWRDGDARIGQWSNPVSITVGG